MKEKLNSILENPSGKLIAIDLDGTLCEGEFWGDGNPTPKRDMIDLINSLYYKGAHVIIWTARIPSWFEKTQVWLHENKVLYHGIAMHEKIGADLYIDDKCLNVEDILNK